MKDYNLYVIDRSYEGCELRTFLKRELKLSHRTLINLKKNNSMKVNGETAYTNTILKVGDRLEITLAEEESEGILPEPMELDIVYEDEYMAVLNKPYNMPVHPTRRHYMGTLANGLVYHWMNRERSTVIRPVNRLDKDTSGLVVFAKNAHIQHLLSMNMAKPEFEKRYEAIVEGCVEICKGTINAPIAREYEGRVKRTVREDGERAVTHYELKEQLKDASLLDILLETGRTHQIRVHMSYIGHPLLGDDMYGGSLKHIHRHALHAGSINMLHPITNQWLYLKAELPEDMKNVIERLRERTL
ncbi:MAG: RluA family pseudouridine synthase [Bacillota bacterium]